ncbi:MAG TPA: tetratricopeptide repeat protein [Myxococcota bacterium]|nr:tetratricopeptide repeat protein [Myxococcota bacterium]
MRVRFSVLLSLACLVACVSQPPRPATEDLTFCRAGWQATEAGDNPRALALFQRCIAEGHLGEPALAQTWRNIGITYRHMNDWPKAIDAFDQALAHSPQKPWEDYVNRANTWSDAGDSDKALADYQRALDVHPDYDQAHLERGIEYERQGKQAEAYADFQRAYELGMRSDFLMGRIRDYRARGFGKAPPVPGGPLEKLGSSYAIGPRRPAKEVGSIWTSATHCRDGLAADSFLPYPDADSVRKARAYAFPSGDLRVAFPELPSIAKLDVRVQLGDTARGVRDDYLSFSDGPLRPVFAAVVRSELPKTLQGRPELVRDAVLRQIDALSGAVPPGQMVVRDLDGPWGPLIEVLVANREGTPCFPTSDYRVLPPDAPASTVGVSRYLARGDVLIEIALIVRMPPDVPKARQGEYARERMNELMGSLTFSGAT